MSWLKINRYSKNEMQKNGNWKKIISLDDNYVPNIWIQYGIQPYWDSYILLFSAMLWFKMALQSIFFLVFSYIKCISQLLMKILFPPPGKSNVTKMCSLKIWSLQIKFNPPDTIISQFYHVKSRKEILKISSIKNLCSFL